MISVALQAGGAAQLEETKSDLAKLQSQEQQLRAELQQLQTKHNSLQVAASCPATCAAGVQRIHLYLLLHLAISVRFHTCCVSLRVTAAVKTCWGNSWLLHQ